MENIGYMLMLELLLAVWYLKATFLEPLTGIYMMLLVLLLYFSFKIFYYLRLVKYKARNNLLQWIIPLVTAVGILLVHQFLLVPVVLFFSFCLYQGLGFLKQTGRYIALALSVVFGLVVTQSFLEPYIVASTFSWFVLFLLDNAYQRIDKFSKQRTEMALKIEAIKETAEAAKASDASAKYASQLEERNRIAQKLHDELGHTLSGSTMQMEAAMLLIEQEPEKAKAMLATVTKGLREGTEAIRRILKDIKPEAATINIGSIKQMAAEAKEKSGVQTDVAYDSGVSVLTPKQWQVITDNIREALTNIMKHSKATRTIITFDRLNRIFKVSIKDNGKGCIEIKNGLGLSGMEERTVRAGGTLITDGTNGFSVIMLLPIEQEKE